MDELIQSFKKVVINQKRILTPHSKRGKGSKSKVEPPKKPKSLSQTIVSSSLPVISEIKKVGTPVNKWEFEQSFLNKISTLPDLKKFIGDCKRCKLCHGRANVVFGDGDSQSKILFIGEGPGQDEDKQGLPFVGRAGQLLTKMIEAMGYSRKEVYIANIVKCRPPNNRVPEPDEVQACVRFLHKQIDIIQPKILVLLGATAAKSLLQLETPISQLRGNFLDFTTQRGFKTKLIPTYHPAYLLRNPSQKKVVWEDLQKVMKFMKE